MPTSFNISVLAENTHWNPYVQPNALRYYGSTRTTMDHYDEDHPPYDIQFITACVRAGQGGHNQTANGTIIMLPEFILQPLEGAYTQAQRDIVDQYLQDILDHTPSTVLVIFGTVISEGGAPNEFYNDMVYGIGGGQLRHTGKFLLSNIDLFPVNAGIQHPLIFWANIAGNDRLVQNLDATIPVDDQGHPIRIWAQSPNPTHTINFQRKTIGFTVCLDYAEAILGARLNNYANANRVDILLTSSCGMKFIDGNKYINFCKNKGKVVVCDADGLQSSVRQINSAGYSVQRSSMLTTRTNIAIRPANPIAIRRTRMTVYTD